MAILDNAKLALRITGNDYDAELNQYIESAKKDLGIAGVEFTTPDVLVETAIITYTRMRFGNPPNYKELKSAYDEQKAQLMKATGYTNWGVE